VIALTNLSPISMLNMEHEFYYMLEYTSIFDFLYENVLNM